VVQAGAKLTAGSKSGERRRGSGATRRGSSGWRSSPRDTCTVVDTGARVAGGGERDERDENDVDIKDDKTQDIFLHILIPLEMLWI